MIKLLKDPAVFNYIIMALFIASGIRWAFARSLGDVSYWFASFWIVFTMTFLMKR